LNNQNGHSFGSGLVGTAAFNIGAGGVYNGGGGNVTLGNMNPAAASTVTMSSAITTINGTNAGLYAITNQTATANFIANNGSVIFSYAGGDTGINMAGAGTDLTLYNVTVSLAAGAKFYLDASSGAPNTLTANNNMSVTQGNVDTRTGVNNGLTVNGTLSIGDGVGAVNTANILCNASAVDCNGNIIINSDGHITLPTSAGSFNFSGNAWQMLTTATITHSGGTVTIDGVLTKHLQYGTFSFYNIVVSAGSFAFGYADAGGNVTVSVDNSLINNSTMRIGDPRIAANVVTLIFGTATQSGSFTNNGIAEWGVGPPGLGSTTLGGFSSAYPAICTGNDWNWDASPNIEPIVQDIIYATNMTSGGGGITITAIRCAFTGTMTVSAGDDFIGANCGVPRATLTVNGTLVIRGHHDVYRNINSRLYLFGGAYHFTVNEAIQQKNVQKLGTATITVDPGVTLTVQDVVMDGRPVIVEGDLVDTNNGTVTVVAPNWDQERFTAEAG